MLRLYLLGLILISSCHEKAKVKEHRANIYVYSDFGCYYHVTYNGTDSGTVTTAVKKEYAINETKEDSVISQNRFLIIEKSDRTTIDKIIDSIKLNPKIDSVHTHDSFRFTCDIDNIRVIDVYGGVKQLNDLLKIMAKNFAETVQDKCGFFRMLH